MKNILKNFAAKPPSDKIAICVVLLLMVGVFPMFWVRVLQNNWIMALLDAVIVFCGCVVGVLVYHGKYVEKLKFVLALFIILAMLLTSIYGNAFNLYWVYPGTLAVFFLIKPRIALLLNILMAFALLPILSDKVELKDVATVYATLIPSILFIFYFSSELRRQHELLNLQATQDFLTRAGNRRAFENDAKICVDSFKRYQINSSLILFDMDHFKMINDKYGHAVGDDILKESSKLVSLRLRRTDKLYRLGGEEFIILMQGASAENAQTLAKDLQAYVAKKRSEELPKYTMSFGIAQLTEGDTVLSWVDRADKALYQSKDAGRDRISTL
ncbi:GGDEF domain-containing protein [Glaciecola sp. 1036]|uniref:GGDEF domain-containing protein n=1 Tax=Alteromonadaceae TaxID=72275 RepID=UPI003CFE308A